MTSWLLQIRITNITRSASREGTSTVTTTLTKPMLPAISVISHTSMTPPVPRHSRAHRCDFISRIRLCGPSRVDASYSAIVSELVSYEHYPP